MIILSSIGLRVSFIINKRLLIFNFKKIVIIIFIICKMVLVGSFLSKISLLVNGIL